MLQIKHANQMKTHEIEACEIKYAQCVLSFLGCVFFARFFVFLQKVEINSHVITAKITAIENKLCGYFHFILMSNKHLQLRQELRSFCKFFSLILFCGKK